MARYAYKDTWGVVDEEFELKWCEDNGIDQDELMEGDPIDWAQWSLLSDYIFHLQSELEDKGE